jgi:hypothetical protein
MVYDIDIHELNIRPLKVLGWNFIQFFFGCIFEQ